MISAKIIADSIANNIRLTTMELCYPRFIHSEFMTHRMFSRSASSNRAIPVQKILDEIKNDTALPTYWGVNQPGMQADWELTKLDKRRAYREWEALMENACYCAEELLALNVHKQVANRVLEPFQHIKVIVTATEWDNFFALRLHPDAQPEMQELARVMKEAITNSKAATLFQGEYHLPYVVGGCTDIKAFLVNEAIKCSVARCARVSYNNHDNSTPDTRKDLALADKLLESGHMSPFEHVATPMPYYRDILSDVPQTETWVKGITHIDRDKNLWSGNLRGWISYRNLL